MASPLLLLFLLLAVSVIGPSASAPVPVLRHPEDARRMKWAQLDALFQSGTIEGGIPAGYTYGYAIVNPAYPGWQTLADGFWHGKHFEVLFEADPDENCGAGDEAGIKGCGGPRGVVTNYLSLLPGENQRVFYQEMPGLVYIGHLHDISAPLEALQLDDKPSIIVDYRNSGGDELRLVNAKDRIYLGRGTDWSAKYAHIFAYFVLQLSDVPVADEINWIGPAHTKMRDQTFEAAGVRGGDPDPRLVQERRVRRARRERQPRRTAAAATTAPLLEHPEDARSMTPEQLDDLYKRATVEGGLPDGYGYGYPIVHPDFPVTQVLTDNHWHGKHFEVLSKEGEPERGIVFNYITLLPRDEKAFIQEVPGVMFIGRYKDVYPPLEALEVDDKPSIIIDYRNHASDQLRLVNAEERIYLGRATNWFHERRFIIAYFVLQFSDRPKADEINYKGHLHMRLRDGTFEAAGVPGGDPNPLFIQERSAGEVRREQRRRPQPTPLDP